MPEKTVKEVTEELTKKFNSDLKTKAEEIKNLKAELSKRVIDERVTKIHSVNKEFKYDKDKMSSDYLDGVIVGMSFKVAKKEHSGVTIPSPEKKKAKKGWIVENQTGLEENGEQL